MAAHNPAVAIQTHFADLEDPRIERTRRHDLMDILVIALCAVICGAEGWVDIAKYGVAKSVGEAATYQTKEAVDAVVREHILVRNGLRERKAKAAPGAAAETPAAPPAEKGA